MYSQVVHLWLSRIKCWSHVKISVKSTSQFIVCFFLFVDLDPHHQPPYFLRLLCGGSGWETHWCDAVNLAWRLACQGMHVILWPQGCPLGLMGRCLGFARGRPWFVPQPWHRSTSFKTSSVIFHKFQMELKVVNSRGHFPQVGRWNVKTKSLEFTWPSISTVNNYLPLTWEEFLSAWESREHSTGYSNKSISSLTLHFTNRLLYNVKHPEPICLCWNNAIALRKCLALSKPDCITNNPGNQCCLFDIAN